ncbi:MAG: efflux RND transporter periplasmic adaptor subunit [Acidobacteria bacterium]|nr:efflux RND transporter periplasmic adaptor subunit [Acidobacteriota bacterium]
MKRHGALLLVLLAGLSGCSTEKPQQPAKASEAVADVEVFVVPAADSAAVRPLTVASTLAVEREADLIAQEEGRLLEVTADMGQRVKQGELLARLDASRLRKQLEQDRAEARMLEATAKQAEVLRQAAEVELQRQSELRKEGLGSMRDFDRARFSLESYKVEIVKAAADFERAKAKVEDGEIRLSRMDIRAPFDGIVSRRYARVGQSMLRDEKVLRLTELRPLLVRFTVPESARHAAASGAVVEVFPADAAASAAKARVVRTSMVVDASSGSLECTAQLVEPVPAGLVPGMAVDVRVPGATPASAAPTVPASALRRTTEDRADLFVIAGDRLQKRNVKIGRESASGVQVLSGISGGERIVARVTDKLQDGMAVRVR